MFTLWEVKNNSSLEKTTSTTASVLVWSKLSFIDIHKTHQCSFLKSVFQLSSCNLSCLETSTAFCLAAAATITDMSQLAVTPQLAHGLHSTVELWRLACDPSLITRLMSYLIMNNYQCVMCLSEWTMFIFLRDIKWYLKNKWLISTILLHGGKLSTLFYSSGLATQLGDCNPSTDYSLGTE